MATQPAMFDGDARSGPRPSFQWRAGTALKATAAFAALVAVILAAGPSPLPVPTTILILSVGAFCVVSFIAARGLGGHRSWAVAAAPAMLWMLIASGLVDVIVGMQHATIQIPVGAVLAVWAFRAPRHSSPPALDRAGSALAATFLVVNAALSLGPWVWGPAGPFALGEADLAANLSVECGPAGAGVPGSVPLSLRWSWSKSEAFPYGTDGIAIAWRSADSGGQELFALGEASDETSLGFWTGGGSPSSGLADALIAEYGNGVAFGIDLAIQQYGPGQVAVTLQRSSAAPVAHGDLEVEARYVHLGRWTSRAIGACHW